MIKIEKSSEPKSWTSHRLTKGAVYEANDDLRNTLLKDQGYICAYCMRRIPAKDNNTTETSRIEHIKPQSTLSREEAMDFSNMVICCPGAITSTEHKLTHCDRHKAENPIHFSPLDTNFISTLSYKTDGSIVSSNKKYNNEINSILNLNIPILKQNRKEVRNTVISMLGKGNWSKAELEKILQRYSSKDADGKLPEYCGVVISYITKKLRQHS
ncbi:MAG: TIGR02646 family protein [Bacteroides sp.]|nr:TIGR02646 family protein [Bacteroides sp.]